MDDFWAVIAAQLAELRSARSAADVMRTLSSERHPDGKSFFAGPSGEEAVSAALRGAGWIYVWVEFGNYSYWALRAPNGDAVTYAEGEVYLVTRSPQP